MRYSRLAIACMLLALVGCTNSNSPVAPIRPGMQTQDNFRQTVPVTSTTFSSYTYEYMIDNVTDASSAYVLVWNQPAANARVGIGINPVEIPSAYCIISPNIVGSTMTVTVKNSSGSARIRIFRDDGTGPVEIASATGNISGDTGTTCTAAGLQ